MNSRLDLGSTDPKPFVRGFTPHAEAVRLMARGWNWNGKKCDGREAWTAAMRESFWKTENTH